MDLKSFNQHISKIPVGNETEYLYNVFPKSVKIIKESEGERVMLCTYNRNFHFKYNGLIIANNKVISVSNKPPLSKYNPELIRREFKNAVVYPANDGTTVTLYFWNKEWRMSSHRGYDIGNYTRFSLKGEETSKTYRECLNEVLLKYNINYDNLDKNKCYTLGFRHPELQPFDNDNLSAWFIQSVDLEKFNSGDPNYMADNSTSLPNQNPLNIDLDKAMEKAQNAYTNFCENGIINYGYLLKINSNLYLLESSLLSKIRKTFYSIKFNKFPKNNRIYHIILFFFLDPEYYTIFQKLFPQYKPMFNKIEKQINTLIKSISNIDGEKNYIVLQIHKEISKVLTIENYSKNKRCYYVSKIIYNKSKKAIIYQYLENNGLWSDLRRTP